MSNNQYVVSPSALQSQHGSKVSFGEFKSFSEDFGAKAAGLLIVPELWRPDFILVNTAHHKHWKDTSEISEKITRAFTEWIKINCIHELIVRSSGVNEKIGDRGKYKSIVVSSPINPHKINTAIKEVYCHAYEVDPDEGMGIILQSYVRPSLSGHLSNEVRLSPTRNQWKYEVEYPTWAPAKGLNSKFAPSPDISTPIICGKKIPHQGLRSVGKWVNNNVIPRTHIEWLSADNKLYLVQLDMEWAELDGGYNPKVDLRVGSDTVPDIKKASVLTPYKIGTPTPWKKLENLSIFDFDQQKVGPNLFLLKATKFEEISQHPARLQGLIEEIKAVTADRAVVRTDCKDPKARSFNLPRTDTVQASEIPKWCMNSLKQLNCEGIKTADIGFLIHAFLPSRASAWAYARPGNSTVIVDALWGLPDGLQVLPVDTYEVNIARQKIIDTKSTFKPRFLQESSDGSWIYQNIMRSKGRSRVLTPTSILEVATRTANIAQKLNDDAQIMWFCGIPKNYGVGQNIPWFRSREKFDAAPRVDTKYKVFEVRNPNDLEKLPDRQATIKLSPEVDLIRDDDFLQKIIDVAIEKKLPVQLEGSMLGHTYYRLSQAGVGVVLANAPKYYRKRDSRIFGKIVRDKISSNIQSGGEAVREAVLDKSDIAHGLAGKMLEELEEYLLAKTSENKLAELADVLEVLKGLVSSEGFDWEEVLTFAEIKRNKRGGFEERKVLLETSLPHSEVPIDSVPTIGIGQIGNLEVTDVEAMIPLTALINSIGRAGIRVNILEGKFSVDLSIKDGRLKLTPIEVNLGNAKPEQPSLFDDI